MGWCSCKNVEFYPKCSRIFLQMMTVFEIWAMVKLIIIFNTTRHPKSWHKPTKLDSWKSSFAVCVPRKTLLVSHIIVSHYQLSCKPTQIQPDVNSRLEFGRWTGCTVLIQSSSELFTACWCCTYLLKHCSVCLGLSDGLTWGWMWWCQVSFILFIGPVPWYSWCKHLPVDTDVCLALNDPGKVLNQVLYIHDSALKQGMSFYFSKAQF